MGEITAVDVENKMKEKIVSVCGGNELGQELASDFSSNLI